MVESIFIKYLFVGRLVKYKYYDTYQIIGSALSKFKKKLIKNGKNKTK